MINIEQIAEDFKIKNTNHYADQDYYSENVVKAIKEALRQAIPEILEEVANRAEIIDIQEEFSSGYYSIINKESITSLSELLIEKYTK